MSLKFRQSRSIYAIDVGSSIKFICTKKHGSLHYQTLFYTILVPAMTNTNLVDREKNQQAEYRNHGDCYLVLHWIFATPHISPTVKNVFDLIGSTYGPSSVKESNKRGWTISCIMAHQNNLLQNAALYIR
ncbi:hypothetical protein RF11_10186 [Thelohanellus kitauei]|uniref:Uncharacterized protein n=1 Tax=Thelohanellus kitauei TaxID=669202 RepID=A0A0C2JSH2_THEKT|nr:hypothetical protein RF11_10186 [Thelohanellus kitauei]